MSLSHWIRRLLVRVFLLLSLALLPIGLIAVYQTSRVSDAAENNARLALLALTDQAAGEEQLIIERAFGSAQMLGTIAPIIQGSALGCRDQLRKFIATEPSFGFAGIVDTSGLMACSSGSDVVNLSQTDSFQFDIENPRPRIRITEKTKFSGATALIITQPFFEAGILGGFVLISVPHDKMKSNDQVFTKKGLLNLITFNNNGTILTAHNGLEEANANLPPSVNLRKINVLRARSFTAKNSQGKSRLYTVSPVKGSPITVLGIWDTRNDIVDGLSSVLPAWTFPVLMWLVSLAVAMLALHTLVLRHVSRLRRDILDFEQKRALPDQLRTHHMPSEIEDVYRSFYEMAENILRDEARMEDVARDKSVLVKEVHHRVKNNLQMICSIMNMQIGRAKHAETRLALERLQDRVLSLATIHRDLYQSQNQGQVNATHLVTEIVEKSIDVATLDPKKTNVTTSYDPLMLYPDQVVPLSLLVSEVMTNALKYVGPGSGETSRIDVRLSCVGSDVTLAVSNSIGQNVQAPESTGLGQQLMRGFVMQLGGKMEVVEEDGMYSVILTFRVADFAPESVDF